MTDTDEFIPDLANASFEDVEPKPERTRKPRSDKGQSRGPRGSGARTSTLKSLADDLLVPWAMLASGLGMVMPTVTAVMITRGEKTVDAFLNIAKGHPRMLEALKKASKMGPATELATTGTMIVIAGALDMGRLPPEHPIAMSLGITDLYMQTHPQDIAPDMNGHPFAPPPGMTVPA